MNRKTTYSSIVFVFCLFVFGLAGVSENNPDSLNTWIESQLINPDDTNEVFTKAHYSLFISNKENNEAGLITAYLNLARFHEQYGQLDSAIYYYKELKDIYKNVNNNEAVAETCLELKGLYSSKAAYAESMKQVMEALALYENNNNQKGIALCYTHLCDLLYYEDKYKESVDYCDKAIVIQQELDAKRDLAVSYRYKASSLLFVEGALEQALETVNKAIEVYHEIGETGIPVLAAMNGRGNILKYMERYDEAIADYQFIYDKCLEMAREKELKQAKEIKKSVRQIKNHTISIDSFRENGISG